MTHRTMSERSYHGAVHSGPKALVYFSFKIKNIYQIKKIYQHYYSINSVGFQF